MTVAEALLGIVVVFVLWACTAALVVLLMLALRGAVRLALDVLYGARFHWRARRRERARRRRLGLAENKRG